MRIACNSRVSEKMYKVDVGTKSTKAAHNFCSSIDFKSHPQETIEALAGVQHFKMCTKNCTLILPWHEIPSFLSFLPSDYFCNRFKVERKDFKLHCERRAVALIKRDAESIAFQLSESCLSVAFSCFHHTNILLIAQGNMWKAASLTPLIIKALNEIHKNDAMIVAPFSKS